MRMEAGAALALLLFTGISGCVGGDLDLDETGGEEPFFPPRTEARDKPVLLVHGFNLGEASDATNWDLARAHLLGQGWPQVLTYGYYGCDAGFDRHVSGHGAHDQVRSDPGAHVSDACGTYSHTGNTPIQHLASHWAWAVHDEFASQRRCVDVVAHSMGGLIVRYALHGVETGQSGFPPVLCVEDAVTLGTPHGGAGWIGEVCADVQAFTQCQQMTDRDGFLTYLAQNALTPRGSTQTEWTVVGSKSDLVVGLYSALGMAAHQAIMYLGGQAIGHAMGTSFLSADPLGLGHVVRFRDPGADWLIAHQAPAPLGWADQALVHRGSQVVGVPPPVPTAYQGNPPAEAGVAPGRTLSFEGGCSNPAGDLDRVEWWTKAGSGPWTARDVDSVQLHEDPWSKSRSFSFDNAGTYQVRFQCVNNLESTAEVVWTIHVDSSYNDEPTASRSSPSSPMQVTRGDRIAFAGTCADPTHDLDHAEWWRVAPGGSSQQEDIDTVQVHEDPWHTSISLTFPTEGEHTVRLRCIDTAGAQHDVDWSVLAVAPAGPTATRYAPAATVSISQGESVTFEAACSNPDDELDRGEWWVRPPGGSWYVEGTDTVQWSSDPWEKSRTYTFSDPGGYGIRFRCVNKDGASGDVEWSVQVS